MKNLKSARVIVLCSLFLQISPTTNFLVYANGIQQNFAIIAAGQDTRNGKLNKIYSPWKNADGLRNDIIEFLQEGIDENEGSHHPFFSLLLTNSYSVFANELILQSIIKSIKKEFKETMEDEQALFSRDDFVKISDRIAARLNEYLEKDVFKPTDFIPREQDYPRDRDVTSSAMANQLSSHFGIDLEKVVEPEERHRWLTIWEWIDKVYNRIAPSGFPNAEPPTASSAGSSHYPNVIRALDGKLRPADGYRWVNPDGPNDYRVELKPGLTRSEQPRSDKDSRQLFIEAERLQEQKKYREAIENYTAAIGLDPDHTEAYLGRGDAKLELKDYRGAIADYDQIIQLYSVWEAEEKARKVRGETGLTIDSIRFDRLGKYAYNNRGIAKDRLGDKVGACVNFRKSCSLGNSTACENSKEICN